MKIFQTILILLIFFISHPASANRDNDSYDGNIFPVYAGNGAIVPPQTSLKDSLKSKRVSVLFFYLDDSANSKNMAPVISGLDLIWRDNIDLIALTTDEIQNKEITEPTEAGYYWNGLIPQTIILSGEGEVKYDKNGVASIDDLNNIIGSLLDVDTSSLSFSVESFNEYNSRISDNSPIEKELQN